MNKRYLNRDIYLKKIEPYIDKELIKVIVGQRRVGKSYLLFQLMDKLRSLGIKKEMIIYINKELHQFENISDYKDLLTYLKQISTGRGKRYLLIDEIQDIRQFEKALRSLLAEGGYDIYCTGSNANLLSGELATYLSGRHIQIKVFGLSYPEFLYFHKLEKGKESLLKYIRYGGLPYLMNLELKDELVYDYLRNIYNSILYKDIISRHQLRNVAFLERLVSYLADNIGNIISAKKISDFLKSQHTKISPNVVLNYLSYLTEAYFIFKTSRADVVGKKVFAIGEKYYFEDLGLRHSIIDYKQVDIGKVLENLVYLHLKISGYEVNVGKLGEKEIDFVCEKSGEKKYLQVAYLLPDNKAKDREFGNLLEIKDNYPKFVVSLDEMPGGKYKGIEHVNIIDFLSQYF